MDNAISRRTFLGSLLVSAATWSCEGPCAFAASEGKSSHGNRSYPRQAMFYKKLSLQRVRCELCPRKCLVDDRERGFCGVRENSHGEYYTLVHSNPCSVNVDPIEKKPLFHFLPGSLAFSIATVGCNMDCAFCQNWQISQVRPEQIKAMRLPPTQVVESAKQTGSKSIAFTYTEPVIFYEYMLDICKAARKHGIKTVMITNAYIEPDPLKEACRHLDAIKVDFKAFTEKFYRTVCAGHLNPVLDAMRIIKQQGIWLELVNLLIPGLNDSSKELQQMCHWIKSNLGTDVPVHFTRFMPLYKLTQLPPTPLSSLEKARNIALETGLRFVYLGNVMRHPAESTSCPTCKQVVIERVGFHSKTEHLSSGRCAHCKHQIPGVWE